MKIEVTEYTREDGLTLLRLREGKTAHPDGLWVIRRVHGPSWFWDAATSEWVISIGQGFNLSDYALPLEQAMALFQTVKKQ